jgi:SnoaL-like domain
MPSTAEIGRELVALCKQGKNLEAIEKFYSPNIVSIEVCGDENMPARMQGIEAIKGKNKWWFENHTIHGGDASGPFPKDDKFIVHYKMDITAKAGPMAGQRMQIEEAALYTVKDGKIVQEEFFYDMPG